MNILVVLAGQINININKIIKNYNINYIVAVDGGYNHLVNSNIEPNLLIGDFDSVNKENLKNINKDVNIIKLNYNKDESDFKSALIAINKLKNDVDIYVIGFLSQNRIEHFYANIKNINEKITFISDNTKIYLLPKGEHSIVFKGYVSFFAFEEVEGLTLKGFKYPLKNYDLKINDDLCLSNEIADNKGIVSFKKGKLLVFESNKS